MKKTLWFEGAGCAPRGDLSNCRIRTAFRNDEGKVIYLELTGFEANKWDRKHGYDIVGHVDYCYEISEDGSEFRVGEVESMKYEYCQRDILDLVNGALGCSFDCIRIADSFYGYRVHAGAGKVNLMDDHTFDDDHASRAREAFANADKEIMDKLNAKYSKLSLVSVGKNEIAVRCYASKSELWRAGIHREFTVAF